MAAGYGILIGTIVFAFLGTLGFFVAPGPDKGLHRLMVITAIVCMWLMWIVVYMAQINPIIQPEKDD